MTDFLFARFPGFAYEVNDPDGKLLARALAFEYSDSEVYIDSIMVRLEEQGKGYGSEILRLLITTYKDKTLALKVDAFASCRLDNNSLEAWYSRYGFQWDKAREYMVREPS